VDEGSRPPGSLSLYELLSKHAGPLAADFRRFYRLDICDLFRGRLSPKLALALVEQLPVEAATVTSMRGGPEFVGWDRHAFLMADLFDAVESLVFVTTAANAKDPKKVPVPRNYPRPGDKPKSSEPDILLSRLRGGDQPIYTPVEEAGPGAVIPLPPS
jgi:hypothetical protein